MEETVSTIQMSVITLVLYMLAIVASCYFLLLPLLKQFGLNHQMSLGISKVVIVITAAVIFTKHLTF